MTIRRSHKQTSRSKISRRARERDVTRRELRVESLEDRRVMAELAGILVNDGALLRDGDVFHESPRELKFEFNQAARIDPATLGGIVVTGAGLDGQFAAASATTDFNTGGAVRMRFTAATPGPGGNSISLTFTRNNLGSGVGPRITVTDRTIDVELNTNTVTPTTAITLLQAINAHVDAKQLVQASFVSGNQAAIITQNAVNYSPLRLTGGAATASTSFNTGTPLNVTFTAVAQGTAGSGIQLIFTRSARGSVGPGITVQGRTIRVDLNTSAGFQTTAGELVGAMNANFAAARLVTSAVAAGDPTTNIAAPAINYSPLVLVGPDDVVLQPGTIFVNKDREVILRFAEPLPDDQYRVDILGAGTSAVKELNGTLFHEGKNVAHTFKVDRGPQIVSVVPQPIARDTAGKLVQRRDQIVVYFNADDLFVQTAAGTPAARSAENAAFYQLIFTRDTVENTDDVAFFPATVKYDAASDRATLTFATDLDELIDPTTGRPLGAGNFRLRIGTAESTPQRPVETSVTLDGGSTFSTALNVGTTLTVGGTGDQFSEGQTFSITDERGVSRTFEFDSGFVVNIPQTLTLQLPLGAGAALPDGETFTITNGPVQHTFEFDNVDLGNGAFRNNIRIAYSPTSSLDQLANSIVAAINGASPSLGLRPKNLGSGRVHLGSTSAHTLNLSGPSLARTGQPQGIRDGDRIVIRDGSNPAVTFEFDSNNASETRTLLLMPTRGGVALIDGEKFSIDDGVNPTATFEVNNTSINPGLTAGNREIRVTGSETASDLAAIVQSAISGAGLGISVSDLGSGVLELRGATGYQVDVTGSTFRKQIISVIVPFNAGLTNVEQAQLFINAVNSQPLRLSASQVGSGVVHLGGTPQHTLDTSGANVTRSGTPGVTTPGAIPVLFAPGSRFSAADVAAALTAAINGAGFAVRATAQRAPLDVARLTLVGSSAVSVPSSLKLTTQGLETLIVSSSIDAQPYALPFPGEVEPGHRKIRVQSHVIGGADTTGGVPTFFYNFQDEYGFDPLGNVLHNVITENQKQRTREIFELYGQFLGARFVESANLGFTIVTGDMRAIDPTVRTGPGGIFGLSSQDGRAILDGAENWSDTFGQANNPSQPSWFEAAMEQIGFLLGLRSASELAQNTINGGRFNGEPALSGTQSQEFVYPGDNDIVHGQYLFRPDSNDIDLYEFDLSQTGVLAVETLAERLQDASLLDTVVTLYREIRDQAGNVTGRELIARNDDYFSKDSFLELRLPAGRYFVGVSASGNHDYNPLIEDSGLGGTSQGQYQLRLTFRPDADRAITDTTGNEIDADLDGRPGGVYNFWFRNQDRQEMVVTGGGATFVDGTLITITDTSGNTRKFEFNDTTRPNAPVDPTATAVPFTPLLTASEMAQRLANAINADVVLQSTAIANGTTVQLLADRQVVFGAGLRGVTLKNRTIYVDKANVATGDGSIQNPYRTISAAIVASQAGDVVRIVGNGGADGDLATLGDNLSYDIGFSRLGVPLADGSTLQVPKGVTVMIDSGAVFKMRRAEIGVGSTTSTVDRSASALQVLGTPRLLDAAGNVRRNAAGVIPGSVYFTSIGDSQIGQDADPDTNPPLPAAGDWGGLDFRGEIDRANRSRFDYEREGIFLNYVNNADMRYGGGDIVVVGQGSQTVNPISMIGARPTATFNTITLSAHAAISANPNSFEETNFVEPQYQEVPFTPDYGRVGPEVRGNRITDNSINGLFLRVQTRAGEEIQKLSVPGRFDDTDIVHVLTENLIVQGTPGGPVLDIAAPPTTLITLTARAGGGLGPGTYNYRLTFVDAAGSESAASNATADIVIGPNQSIELGNLPLAPAGFVARNVYRSANNGAGPYTLVQQINPDSVSLTDNGTTRGGTLQEFLDGQGLSRSLRSRFDASLVVDPGVVVKAQGSRIEVEIGAQLVAEGRAEREVIFTSTNDDRYGAGGSFDTTGNGSGAGVAISGSFGDWSGIYFGPVSTGSLDHFVIAHAGGASKIEGQFVDFNALEIHQGADVRLVHGTLERNDSGSPASTTAPANERSGRGSNTPSVIFVRGAQPILADNVIQNNAAAAISINVNSLNKEYVHDLGRGIYHAATSPAGGGLDRITQFDDNQGPLVRQNRIDRSVINGMVVRGGVLTTEGVWDDTDVTHVILDRITVPDFHVFGGLRIASSGTNSLVVKAGGGTAGFEAGGRPLDITDRIGGSLQVVGNDRHPVQMTSINDCTVGAGLTPDGRPMVDLLNSGLCDDTQVNTGTAFVDLIVLADESGSMTFAQVFTQQLIPEIDQALIAAGVGVGGTNRFGLVGYGDFNDVPRIVPVGPGGALYGTSAEYAIAAQTLTASGATEDGWETIHFTLDNYTFRPNAAKFFILVTNEDRDDLNGTPTKTFANTLQRLQQEGVVLEGIYETTLQDGAGAQAIALDSKGTAYLADGTGGFKTSPGGVITSAFGTTQTDYIDMSFATNGIIGDINQISNGPPTTTSFSRIFASTIVSQVGGGSDAKPGDWAGGATIGAFSNDRNVDAVVELEPSSIDVGPDTNQSTQAPQLLGALARNEQSSDDILRLGFDIHGFLNTTSDLDVYSFEAAAGTEVWLDVDRTSHTLDSVVELITSDEEIIAQSDNSGAEGSGALPLFKNSSLIVSNHVNGLKKSTFEGQDFYTTNPRDAGMRVVLPGTPGQRQTYFVRVRSSNLQSGDPRSRLQDRAAVHQGLTSGSYQLQVRLREADEVAGSTVHDARIRFATSGIAIQGGPQHSPLAGEAAEGQDDLGGTNNDTRLTAVPLGNLLSTDRGTLGIAGRIGHDNSVLNGTDVDFFQFDVQYDSVELQGTHLATMFDLDYADGIARANTAMSVFDANGRLILTSRDSNIAEDRPRPLAGTDLSDLSRGTVGALDPYIGTVELPVGRYFLAVHSDAVAPVELQQFLQVNPANPLLRLEPVNSLTRIAEDHIDSAGGSTANPPLVPVLFNRDNSSNVPFHLGDIVTFVSQDFGFDRTRVVTVDPLTGARETIVGEFTRDIRDIALRPDGQLLAYGVDLDNLPYDDTTADDYFVIDTGNGALAQLGNSGIQTNEVDPTNLGASIRSNPVNGTRIGHGIDFQAITFLDVAGQLRGFSIGGRPQGVTPLGVAATQNILYQFDPNTGAASSQPQGDRTGAALATGAGTNIVERGVLNTSADPFNLANTLLILPEATTVDPRTGQTTFQIQDGTKIRLDDDGLAATPPVVFEFNSGPEVTFVHAPATGVTVRDGDMFSLDATSVEFNTGAVLVVQGGGNRFNDGDRILLEDAQGNLRTFELDRDGLVGGSTERIPFDISSSQSTITNNIIQAINNAVGFGVKATRLNPGSNRITLTGDSLLSDPTFTRAGPNGASVVVEGSGAAGGVVNVRVEETFNSDQFANALLQAFGSFPGVTASRDGTRINFSGAINANFSQLVNRGVFTVVAGSSGNFDPNNLAINFLASDSASEIASRVLNAFTLHGTGATASGRNVQLAAPAKIVSADPPIRVGGAAPGGLLTGIAPLNGSLFAVSDAGGLFEILNPTSANAQLRYVTSSAADLLGIRFTGLTAGPKNAEGGRLSELLFGIDADGQMYAFNTNGELQGVFVDGATSVATGVANAHGIAFSTLDTNLWSVTTAAANDRGLDAGHGVNASFDGSRAASPGSSSLHFGKRIPLANNTLSGFNQGNYSLPGGAHGAIVSNPFSLAGYSAADAPILYFNYFAATEGTNSTSTNPMLDAFRVFASADGGSWELLATNNSNPLAELALGPFTVQELFDNTNGWRQARVNLGAVAGRENIRLRFDFSTAGSTDFGGIAGTELQTVPAFDLRDGQTFTIDNVVFEIDLGLTLVLPSGSGLTHGETVTIDGQVFQFVAAGLPGPTIPGAVGVPFDSTLSSAAVAENLERAINNAFTPPLFTLNLQSTEPNATLFTATDTGLTGGFENFSGNGVIGDIIGLPARDVDMLKVQLRPRDHVQVDIDAASLGSTLDSYLRVFDSNGVEIASNNDGIAVGETPSGDSFLEFTSDRGGTFYIAIGGAGNTNFDPRVEGSGQNGSRGDYQVRIEVTNEHAITQRNGNRIQLPNADSVVVGANSLLRVDGSRGTTGNPVMLHAGMPATRVADLVKVAIADAFAGGNASAIRGHGEIVNIIGHTVSAPGPFGLASRLSGEQFGDFRSNLGGMDLVKRAVNNNFEGVYVDDIVIGFAERGEMVTGATGNSTFAPNPLVAANQILVGEYQVEIRRGSEYADSQPTTLRPNGLRLVREFDTNDRLSRQHTLIAPAASELADGQTFTLGDGVNSLTFEFDDTSLPASHPRRGVTPGRVRIPFDPVAGDSDGVIAQRIRDAINGSSVQAVLKITAAQSDGTVAGSTSSSNRVNLFGNVVTEFITPSLVVKEVTTDANKLRDALLGPGITAVGNATLTGSAVSSGLFEGGGRVIGIESGVLLTSGEAKFAEGPNRNDGSGGTASSSGDADLDAEFGVTTEDAATLEFSFNTTGGDLFFNFVFASEEYNEFVDSQFNDVFAFFVDGQNIAFLPGTQTPVSINTVNGGNPLGTGGTNSIFYNNNDLDDSGRFLEEIGYDGFTDVFQARALGLTPGVHVIKLAIADVGDLILDSGVFIQAFNSANPDALTRITGERFDETGDQNLPRTQGQVLIHSNQILDSANAGIAVDAGNRDLGGLSILSGDLPHPGAPRNLREINGTKLLPGPAIFNNVVARSPTGILYSGDALADAPVSFGKVYNNTLVLGNVGINVTERSGPTLINNIISGFTTGISVDASSAPNTVVGYNLFQKNSTNSNIGLGTRAIVLGDNDPLFVDPVTDNYYLASGSQAIDSAIDSLADRSAFTTVKRALGIADSPIVAPVEDVFGQSRVDDPSVDAPPGQGASAFRDRGAIERADFVGPSAVLTNPRDNDAQGADTDARDTFVEVAGNLERFTIQLIDGIEPLDANDGTGAAKATVTSASVRVLKNGVRLVDGVDYKFSYDATSHIIILTPLAGLWEKNATYELILANRPAILITIPSAIDVLDGDKFTITGAGFGGFGTSRDFEFDTGYVLTVPQTFQLAVPLQGTGTNGIRDGQTFRVGNPRQGRVVTFEFDSNGLTGGTTTVIPFTLGDTASSLAAKIVSALDAANLGLAPKVVGSNIVHVGTQSFHTVDAGSSALTLTGTAGGVADGAKFTIDDFSKFLTFEFDENGGASATSDIVIDFRYSDTNLDLATKIVNAIRGANVGLSPNNFGDGRIQLGGTIHHVVNVSQSQLGLLGTPGVTPNFGLKIPSRGGIATGLADGQRFSLSQFGRTATFELDNNSVVTPGNLAIPFGINPTANSIADAIVAALASANIGLSGVRTDGGVVTINGANSFGTALNLGTSVFTQLGAPGVRGSVAIPFVPDKSFTDAQMAAAVAAAINTSGIGVFATIEGDQLRLVGATAVKDITALKVAAIADVAGNALKPNQPTGETRFTIFVGTGTDFGDAPSSFPVLTSANGASHAIVNGFHLGALIDSDADGQISADAGADDRGGSDDEDGVEITSALTAAFKGTITVTAAGITATRRGFLDGWIDLNGDGDWNDTGEQVLRSRSLVEGTNTIDIAIPSTAKLGTTYARFRYSSTGGLTTSGPAPDGEVEDYRVTIVGNPWQNPVNRLDVSGDGAVSPIDILLISNYLTFHPNPTNQPLPLPSDTFKPAPFLDVNGDGFVSAQDIALVVNFLNSRVPGNGEGESAPAEIVSALSPVTANESEQRSRASSTNSPSAGVGTVLVVSATGSDGSSGSQGSGSRVIEVPVTLASRATTNTASNSGSSTDSTPGDSLGDAWTDLDDVLDSLAEDHGQSGHDAHDLIFANL